MMRLRMSMILVGWLTATAAGEPLSAGKWLVDLGRDYPLSPQAGLSDVDAELTLLLMQAGARIEPALAEAWRWQVDLLRALDRNVEARDVLGEYITRKPGDVAARLAWVNLSLSLLQTAEARRDFCLKQLESEGLPPEVAADLYQQLADFHWNRGEIARTTENLAAALLLDPHHAAARALQQQVEGDQGAPAVRVSTLLAVLAVSPGDIIAAQKLGDDLTLLGMGEAADEWYAHAAALYESIPPGRVPVDLLVGRAWALADVGTGERARPFAVQVVQQQPEVLEPYYVWLYLARRQKDEQGVRVQVYKIAQAWTALLKHVGKPDPAILAEAAWFLAHDTDELDQADQLIEQALAEAPDSVVAQRAQAAVWRQRGQFDRARTLLEPLVGQDIWSRIEMARVLEGLGRKEEATDWLEALLKQPLGVEQRFEIVTLLDKWYKELSETRPATAPATAPTTQPALDAIVESLRKFPREVLAYPLQPNRFLTVTARMPARDLMPTQPWECTLHMENRGPFAITVGPGMMVESEVLLLVRMVGDKPRSSGPIFRLRLDDGIRLMPGKAIEVSQTLDIGPVRAALIGTPQVSHQVTIEAILNPSAHEEQDGNVVFVPGIGGLSVQASGIRRLPFIPTAEALAKRLAQVKAPSAGSRIEAVELLAMLLAEHQHLAAGRLNYTARSVDPVVIQATLLAAVDDADWQVRARLAECLRWFVLDRPAMSAAVRLINDPHWLVRGLAMRMLADQEGTKFSQVLEVAAQQDPDEWVRRLAHALLSRFAGAAQEAPATAPAATSPGR